MAKKKFSERRIFTAVEIKLGRGTVVTSSLFLAIIFGVMVFVFYPTNQKLVIVVLAVGGTMAGGVLTWINVEYLMPRILTFLRKKTGETLFVSERYAKEINSKAIPACTILGVCFLCAVLTNDYIAAGIVGAVIVAIVGYGWLTTLRARNGWLADNQYEVLELLHFIISKSKSGGLPPGSRVSRHASEVVQVRTSPTEEVVGSRA
jgi:hypothetical protein